MQRASPTLLLVKILEEIFKKKTQKLKKFMRSMEWRWTIIISFYRTHMYVQFTADNKLFQLFSCYFLCFCSLRLHFILYHFYFILFAFEVHILGWRLCRNRIYTIFNRCWTPARKRNETNYIWISVENRMSV